MSTRLPKVTAAEAIRAIPKSGFDIVRQSGSHQDLQERPGPSRDHPVSFRSDPASKEVAQHLAGCRADHRRIPGLTTVELRRQLQ